VCRFGASGPTVLKERDVISRDLHDESSAVHHCGGLAARLVPRDETLDTVDAAAHDLWGLAQSCHLASGPTPLGLGWLEQHILQEMSVSGGAITLRGHQPMPMR
jgi:hypothetical protein